jgi:hypothetical protein
VRQYISFHAEYSESITILTYYLTFTRFI